MSNKNVRAAQAETTKNIETSKGSGDDDWTEAGIYCALPEGADAALISREMTMLSWRMYGWDRYSSEEEEEEAFRRSSNTPAGAAVLEAVEAALNAPGAELLDTPIEITVMTKLGGPLTKTIKLVDGKLVSDGSACVMSKGLGRRVRIDSLAQLAELISEMPSTNALTLGRFVDGLPDQVSVVPKRRVKSARAQVDPNGFTRDAVIIARAAEYIRYEPGKPAFALLDHDSKGMPDSVRELVEAAGGFLPAVCAVLPALEAAGRVVRRSTSAGLYHGVTGEKFPGSGGVHVFVPVADGADNERFQRSFHERLWLHGLGYYGLGKAGQWLDRSLIDWSVGGPERLVFEGDPVLEPPLKQDKAARLAKVFDGTVLDTRESCPPLSAAEQAELRQLQAEAKVVLAPERARVREEYIAERAQELSERTSMPLAAARKIIEKQTEGVLYPDIVLEFDDPKLKGTTVGDVLADPARFEGATMADPLEGVEYGRGKAKVMLRKDGTPWINSFAHGGSTYKLRHNAASATAALDAADKATVAKVFVSVSLNGDLDPVEEDLLRTHAAKLSGVGKTALKDKLATAREKKAVYESKSARDAVIAEFNEKFMVVNEAGKVLVYRPTFNPGLGREEYERIMITDFKELHRPHLVNVGLDTSPVFKPAADIWLNSPERRAFPGGVVFDPQEKHQDDQLNLWRGFAVEPVQGDWSLLRDHIFNVVCAGRDAEFHYLMGWKATMFQFPWLQAETAIVLCGPEGTGKGFLARTLHRLVRQHALHISDPKHLVGSFNRHLLDTVFLFADEAFFAGDKAHMGALKRLITEPTLGIEGKYMNLVEARNRLHIMMASNEPRVVPAGPDARRFAVYNVLDTHMGDRAYFKAIQTQLENGGYAAMLYDLLNYDLSGFDITKVPQTSGLGEQKKLSLEPEENWWMSVLLRGYVHLSRHGHLISPDFQGQWVKQVATEMLYASYLDHFKQGRNYHPITIEGLGRFMGRMGAQGRKFRHLQMSETFDGVKLPYRTPGYLLGTLAEARKAFCKAVKFEVDWQDAREETAAEQKARGGEPPPKKAPKY